MSAIRRVRYFIASLLDRLFPLSCWADLAYWAYGFRDFSDVDFSGKCQRPPHLDAESGGCYCGKNRCPLKDGER